MSPDKVFGLVDDFKDTKLSEMKEKIRGPQRLSIVVAFNPECWEMFQLKLKQDIASTPKTANIIGFQPLFTAKEEIYGVLGEIHAKQKKSRFLSAAEGKKKNKNWVFETYVLSLQSWVSSKTNKVDR
jgi:hypothetical protein